MDVNAGRGLDPDAPAGDDRGGIRRSDAAAVHGRQQHRPQDRQRVRHQRDIVEVRHPCRRWVLTPRRTTHVNAHSQTPRVGIHREREPREHTPPALGGAADACGELSTPVLPCLLPLDAGRRSHGPGTAGSARL